VGARDGPPGLTGGFQDFWGTFSGFAAQIFTIWSTDEGRPWATERSVGLGAHVIGSARRFSSFDGERYVRRLERRRHHPIPRWPRRARRKMSKV
jgi:hypothetical protein